MRAGELRHRVTIQRPVTTQDAYGQPVVTWEDVATVWAAVEDLSGREFIEAQQAPAAQIQTRVRIRYRQGLEPTMRVRWGARLMQVVAILDPTGRREETHLMCAEVV